MSLSVLLSLVSLVFTLPTSPDPLQFLQNALRQNQIVFLGDIHPVAEPKLLVTALIRAQREEEAIDLLVLEVAADQQQWIDRYLGTTPEDTSILLEHPRTLRGHWGISAEYLGIYRAAYRWNAEHPSHPLRILAADLAGWPMAPLPPEKATDGFANRDRAMANAFRLAVQPHPDWRILIFMGGYHGLKSVGGQVTLGRAQDRFDRWFAGYLRDAGAEIYTILTDARQNGNRAATRMFDWLAGSSTGNFAVVLDSATDSVRQPMYDVVQQGFRLAFRPGRFALRTAVDAMILLNRPSPITILR
jgi:hypothetical protein